MKVAKTAPMKQSERLQVFYSIVLSLCWMHRRPITLKDLTSFLRMTEKQARKEIARLEEVGRVAKVPRRSDNGRFGAAWVIADNDALPPEIRDVCQACGVRKGEENCGEERVCLRCLKAMKYNGSRIHLSDADENELSIWMATIVTMPNEHTLS